MNTYDMIRGAIINRHQVTAIYRGLVRAMCPHAIGLKNGREQALFVQFGGESESEGTISPDNPKWRCIPIDGLYQVTVQSGLWYTIDTHTQRQTCIDEVDVEVDY